MAGRPPGAQNKDKPFRDALRMEIAAAGDDFRRLRKIAAALLDKAETGDVQAIQQVADRLDGKPAQAVDLNHDMSDAFAKLWGIVSDGTSTALADGLAQEPEQSAPIRH